MYLEIKSIDDKKEFENGFCHLVKILSNIVDEYNNAPNCCCHNNGIHYDLEDKIDGIVKKEVFSILILSDFKSYQDFLFGFFIALSEVFESGCEVKIERVYKDIIHKFSSIFEHNHEDLSYLAKNFNMSIKGSAMRHLAHIKNELAHEFGCCYGYKLNLCIYDRER